MEKASRGAWIEYEHNPRAMQFREYTLKEFWEIFVDDRPFGADSINRQVNVQSKSSFLLRNDLDGEDPRVGR